MSVSKPSSRPAYLSFVVPVKDEALSLSFLFDEIQKIMQTEVKKTFEVVFVDDGSEDDSWRIIKGLAEDYPSQVKGLRLRRNFGKAVALAVGFKASRGAVIFTLDADLQDDPREIPRFLSKLEAGYDVVSGWKEKRFDPLSKTLPSRLFNRVTSFITGIPLHDFNCGFKAYRREVLESIKLYGELHRYIPVLAHDLGFRIGEISVKHHKRRSGKSKYGWERYIRGFIDLITVLATTRYLQKPGHLFGGTGILFGLAGTGILAYLSTLWFLEIRPIGGRPLFFLGILLLILGIQLLSLGVVAELITRHAGGRPLDKVVAEETPD